jgi:hypothetical protein
MMAENPETSEILRAREALLANASDAEKDAILAAWGAEDDALSEEEFERSQRDGPETVAWSL